MNKYIKYFAGLLVIVPILIFSFYFKSAWYIQNQIDSANYCDSKDDCVNVGSQCPFGCYIYVNSDQSEKITELVSSYESDCVYSCIYCPDVACVNNRCEAVCG